MRDYFPNSFYVVSNALIPKPRKDIKKNKTNKTADNMLHILRLEDATLLKN